MKKIRVIIVEDSEIMQKILIKMLSSDPEIDIIDTAFDPYEAREKIKKHNPDVITLDIEMPKMNGVEFLKKIMTLRPMPVVMVSSLTEKGADITIQALEIGAIDCIAKPTMNDMESVQNELISKVKNAANVKVKPLVEKINVPKSSSFSIKHGNLNTKIIAIGSSTGGVEALKEIVPLLPKSCPPIVIVQHMPPGYTNSLSVRLDSISEMTVCEATQNQEILYGHVYIAPGDYHMEVKRHANKLFISLDKNKPLVSGHRPAVDVLFSSIAENFKDKEALGIILTGMGKDGAEGMLKMKNSGIYTIGQDEESCVVYGMPRAAKANNAVSQELSLTKIAQFITSHINGN